MHSPYLTIIIVFLNFFHTRHGENRTIVVVAFKFKTHIVSIVNYDMDVRRVIVYHSIRVENNNFWYLRDSTTPLPPDVYTIS